MLLAAHLSGAALKALLGTKHMQNLFGFINTQTGGLTLSKLAFPIPVCQPSSFLCNHDGISPCDCTLHLDLQVLYYCRASGPITYILQEHKKLTCQPAACLPPSHSSSRCWKQITVLPSFQLLNAYLITSLFSKVPTDLML